MNESIPLWEDWRFWQIVVTGALAFLGFTFGTWVKYSLDRRLDRIRRDQENRVFAIAFRAELIALMAEARVRLHALKDLGDAGNPVNRAEAARWDIPAKPVYANNTHRLGSLGDEASLSVVAAHGTADHIRHNVAAMLAQPPDAVLAEGGLDTFRRTFRSLIKRAAEAVNALDAFLGVPEHFPNPEALAAEADPAGPGAPEVSTK